MYSNHTISIRLLILLFVVAGLALAGSMVLNRLQPLLTSQGTAPRPAVREKQPTPLPQNPLAEAALTPVSQAAVPEPLVSGGFIASSGWSPESPWLAYWYTPTLRIEDSESFWTPSELQFYNPANSQLCTHPDVIAHTPAPGAWTADGELLVATGESYLAGEPWEDFRSLTPRQYVDLLPQPLYDPALSTRGTYHASTRLLRRSPGVLHLETVFSEVDSGEDLLRLEWEHPEGPDDPGLGGMWRNNWQFLLHQTLERGPLLVSLGPPLELIAVVPELFGIESPQNADPHPFAGWVAYSTPFYGHFLLQRPAEGTQTPEILFYHRVKNQVESLPFTRLFGTGFYPPGRSGTKPWLMMAAGEFSSGSEQQAYYYREMDTLGEDFTLLGRGSPRLAWQREIYYMSGNRLALGWEDGRVSVQSFPGEQVVGEFSTGDYRADVLEWSSNGRYLAVSGVKNSTAPGMGLFIFELPEP